MRKVYLIILVVFQFGFAQNKALLYNFTSIPQASLVNPGADVSYKYYFGIPLLSGVSANVGSKSFSAYDLFANDGVDFTEKVRNIINKSSANDKTHVNEQVEVFSGGFRVGGEDSQSYVSFGVYQEFDFLMYVPKDLAILALDGNRDHMGKSFNLADLNVRAEALSVLHVGFHKKISEKLVLGGRAKLYSSGANATSTNNSGFIYTDEIEGTQNIYTLTYILGPVSTDTNFNIIFKSNTVGGPATIRGWNTDRLLTAGNVAQNSKVVIMPDKYDQVCFEFERNFPTSTDQSEYCRDIKEDVFRTGNPYTSTDLLGNGGTTGGNGGTTTYSSGQTARGFLE